MVECSMESTRISEGNLSAFIYRLFHENFSSVIRTNTVQMLRYIETDQDFADVAYLKIHLTLLTGSV